MAIEPIQQYRDPSNSLMQVLQGGTQAITGILDRAIQIGRDMTDKRTRQEQDMIGMRLAETNLAQRRGEELQQNIEDAQRFAQNAYQFDRKFGADQMNADRNFTRATAQDVLQQQNADRSYGLAERGLDIRESAEQRQADEVLAENARIQAERDAATKTLNPTTGPTASPETVLTNPQGNIPWRAGTDRAFSKGQLLTPQSDTGIPWANPNSAFPAANVPKQNPTVGVPEMLARPETTPTTNPASTAPSAPDRQKLVTRLGELDALNPRVLTPEQRTKASVEKAQLEDQLRQQGGSSGSPYAAADQAMQEKRFADSQQKAAQTEAQKEIEQLIKGDTTSFVPQGVWIADEAKRLGGVDKIPDRAKAEAKIFDADRPASEIASAKRMTLPQYLAKGPQDAASKAARTKVWNFANGTAAAPSGAVSRIPGI